ncbi:MAG: hypothetical protein MJB57_02660 [Gemmatimonadetes bacterium]|nr:hypothetical protein [Gemmatimonadota bacterium]
MSVHVRRRALAGALTCLITAGCVGTKQDDVYMLPASYNFAFYDTYPTAARSFYAAHFTHFGAYETLMRHDDRTSERMQAFETAVRETIADPPRFEPAADVIAPAWTRLAYPTAQSMHWTHELHSQLYDILTDDRVVAKRDAGERAVAYYLSEPDAAFSTRGYGHRWMEGGGPWAGAFRRAYPTINGVLWAYHWHHAAIYEALMEPDASARARALDRVLAVFEDSVLADLPEVMPLTAEVAPRFARMFPAAAHIFDNLHMMHDVVNDVMAVPAYTMAERGAEIERLRRAMRYADQTAVEAPPMPMGDGHAMSEAAMRVPTRLPSGAWLPQGHPGARMGSMMDWLRPLPPPPAPPPADPRGREEDS